MQVYSGKMPHVFFSLICIQQCIYKCFSDTFVSNSTLVFFFSNEDSFFLMLYKY